MGVRMPAAQATRQWWWHTWADRLARWALKKASRCCSRHSSRLWGSGMVRGIQNSLSRHQCV